ncbi:dipeptidase [Bosea sp. (in: a-proteobacteria)]|uniref:dipeptidase n=1 Tax=Bosea sp. (in: a-proteobacteria) TaxID=1871050 RepID=UPI002610CA29|nr:dipeptidase [Bosea sp. (in: a-proteobacteria)]MCO5091231.1 dipeptidase [Bosea sp. (in: a-proteobacteria)]
MAASGADAFLKRAISLLERVPLLDGHNDLAWVIRLDEEARGDVLRYDLTRVHPEGDTDIPRLREGRVAAQVWAAYVPTDMPQPAKVALEQIDLILRIEQAHPDVFLPARKAADIARAHRLGKIASIIAVEGGVGLENSLAPLRVWQAAGVRLVTLCHNGSLDWVDSATDAARSGGLSAFGRAVVRELNRLGMIVDCAHVSAEVMHHVLDTSTAPIVFSHSNARTLCAHPRNVPDDVLDRLKGREGLVMATFVPDFVSEPVRTWMKPLREAHLRSIGGGWLAAIEAWEKVHGPRPQAALTQVADHIEYLANRIGARRLGIGSDYFGVPTKPPELMNVSRFPHLFAELLRRGWSEEHLAGLAGGNFIRVMRAVEREGRRLRRTRPPLLGTVQDLDGSAAAASR